MLNLAAVWRPFALLLLVCSLGIAPTPQSARALPRIGVRAGTKYAEFYNIASGATFHPNGSNYVFVDQSPLGGGFAHVTFDPGFYDAKAAENSLELMQTHGFNVVRVFIDHGDVAHQSQGHFGIGGPYAGNGLYRPVVDNFIDFLRRARSHDVYVLTVFDGIPHNARFEGILKDGSTPNVTSINQFYLSRGGVQSKVAYATEFVREIRSYDGGSLLTTIFAWEIANEVYLTDEGGPFSMRSGSVNTADGRTYDMSSPESRQACMDSNLIYWARTVSTAIRSQDPGALVTAGMFTYRNVHKAGPNGLIRVPGSNEMFPARPVMLERGGVLPFLDIHAYPGRRYSLAEDLNSSEFPNWDLRSTPYVLGEFGATRHHFGTIDDAVSAARRQKASALALGFTGTLFWTWNALPSSMAWWSAVEEDGAIMNALGSSR